MTNPIAKPLPEFNAPEGFTVAVAADDGGLLITLATKPVASATAFVAPLMLETARCDLGQLTVDNLAAYVARQAALELYPHRPRTSRPLERIEQVRDFLAADPDDADGWAARPCLLTHDERVALRAAVAAKGCGCLESGPVQGPSTYTGPVWDLEGRKREVKDAWVVGQWAGTVLVVDGTWSR